MMLVELNENLIETNRQLLFYGGQYTNEEGLVRHADDSLTLLFDRTPTDALADMVVKRISPLQ